MRGSPKHRQHTPLAESHCFETIKQSEKLSICLFIALYFRQLLSSLQVSGTITYALCKGVTVIQSSCPMLDGALSSTGECNYFFQDLQSQLPF